MNLVIPKRLEKQVRERARKYGVSEDIYVRDVLVHALKSDESLDEEMHEWENASICDFNAFAKKHTL